jgi:hypothetical protein
LPSVVYKCLSESQFLASGYDRPTIRIWHMYRLPQKSGILNVGSAELECSDASIAAKNLLDEMPKITYGTPLR